MTSAKTVREACDDLMDAFNAQPRVEIMEEDEALCRMLTDWFRIKRIRAQKGEENPL